METQLSLFAAPAADRPRVSLTVLQPSPRNGAWLKREAGELKRIALAAAEGRTSVEVDLTAYDLIVINTSGGKDSVVMLDRVAKQAIAQGVLDRVVVVHCDLGRVEWGGTRELAERQAAHYGLELRVVSRGKGDLLDQIEHQRKKFPAKGVAQFCTSDQKTAQVKKLITAELAAIRVERGLKARASLRVLECLGMRAGESGTRSKLSPFDAATRNPDYVKGAKGARGQAWLGRSNGSRKVDVWLPIFDITSRAVWAHIDDNGLEYHRAYDLGMSRLSCAFCVLASIEDLRISGRENRELLNEYVRVEKAIGHTFKNGWAIATLAAELDAEDAS